MKKLFLSFFLLGSLLLVSCSGNSPKGVTEKFLKAVKAYDFKEAQKYCDETTAQMLGMMETVVKNLPDSEKKSKSFTITKVEENGDTAKVFFKWEDSEKEANLDLKKIDGKWKVSINKENGKESVFPGGMDTKPEEKDNTEPDASAESDESATTTSTEANQ